MTQPNDPGNLRHRVRIERLSTAPLRDGFGQERENWIEISTVWAEVKTLAGRELTFARQRQADLTHEVKMRYRAGVTADMRLVFETKILNLSGPPRPDTHKMYMLLDAISTGATAA